jgi:microcystin degradation protein MlrC
MAEATVFVGSFAHESNTFSSTPTRREDFEAYREYYGREALEQLADTSAEVAGVLDATADEDVTLIPSVVATASPSGPVTTAAYDHYTGVLLDDLRAHRDELDGVVLVLHGAMVTEALPDGEGPLVAAVRDVVGPDVPIAVTLDLHGNISDQLVAEADLLVSYETYPHVDMRETGRTATELLLEAVSGDLDPTMHVERPPVLPEEPFEDTNEGPMVDVMERARELEGRDGVAKVNVLFGFHQVDNPTMSFSIPVVADGDEAAARDAARELAEYVWERRESFVGEYPEAEAAVRRAKELVEDREEGEGPVVMADLGPNSAAGASADGTVLLRELLEQEVSNAGYAIVRDPEAVAAAIAAGVGETVTTTVGGKTDGLHGDPIDDLEGYVRAITDGTFTRTGPMDRGTVSHLGRTVRLECGENRELSVILTERLHSPRDAEIWRHVGIRPESLSVLVVHGTNHFRADYAPLASSVYVVDTPGVGSPIPARYDYTNIERPKFPIDEMADDAYPDW